MRNSKKRTSRKRTSKTSLADGLPKSTVAWLEALQEDWHEGRRAYEVFLKSAQHLPPIERAEAWLRHVTEHPDNDGDLEAIVYLVSRGYDCTKHITRIAGEWKEAEAARLREHATTAKIPEFVANDISRSSTFLLRNFWSSAHRSQEDAIDATMLRTVEWCGIGGFEPWWNRLVRTANEIVLRSGVEPVGASFWLFNMCRSPYAIQLMPRVLDRYLEAIELCDEFQSFPWIHTVERGDVAKRRLCYVEHVYVAASLAFCHAMLRPHELSTHDLVAGPARMLQKHQMEGGAWAFWADSSSPSIEATATALHALSLVKPSGYSRNNTIGAEWLLSQQQTGGYWHEEACPDPTYLTVLVLDALALARGEQKVTFRAASAQDRLAFTAIPSNQKTRRFQVAFSFPGELRERVENIAELLGSQIGQSRVFYDNWYKGELARPNLDLYLQDIYGKESDLLLVFLSSDYERKQWCGLEWRAIREIIKSKESERVMFLRVDDAKVSGVLSLDGYLDIRDMSDADVLHAVVTRIASLASLARAQGK